MKMEKKKERTLSIKEKKDEKYLELHGDKKIHKQLSHKNNKKLISSTKLWIAAKMLNGAIRFNNITKLESRP